MLAGLTSQLTKLLFSIYNLTQHKMCFRAQSTEKKEKNEHNYFVRLIESRCEASAGCDDDDDDRFNTIQFDLFSASQRNGMNDFCCCCVFLTFVALERSNTRCSFVQISNRDVRKAFQMETECNFRPMRFQNKNLSFLQRNIESNIISRIACSNRTKWKSEIILTSVCLAVNLPSESQPSDNV